MQYNLYNQGAAAKKFYKREWYFELNIYRMNWAKVWGSSL